MPCRQNIFANKLLAAGYVWNGFGKTAGLVQIQELGTLETPIALTNTLNVGLMQDALVEYMVRRCREDGVPRASTRWWASATTAASMTSASARSRRST